MAKRSKKVKPAEMNPDERRFEDGGEAYANGMVAADCPFEEGTEEFDAWHEQFDAAADAWSENAANTKAIMEVDAEREGDEPADIEKEDRSVVKGEYRARYAEAGHPAHCGDELAVLLNNLCLTKKGIDLPRFEHICEANGVDLSKYNRTSKGWQGRLRMTGRNILARKVYEADGVVKTIIERATPNEDGISVVKEHVPLEGAEAEYKMSKEWMTIRRKATNG